MRDVHTINLSGAWEPPTATGAPWTRRFGRPDGLTGDQRVWLVIEGAIASDTVRLNDRPLAATGSTGGAASAPQRWEITTALAARNVLTLLLPAAAAHGSAPGTAHGRVPLPPSCGRVRLEIEAADEGNAAQSR